MTERHPERDKTKKHATSGKQHKRPSRNCIKYRWRARKYLRCVWHHVPRADFIIAWFTIVLGVAALWSVDVANRTLRESRLAANTAHDDNTQALTRADTANRQARDFFIASQAPIIWRAAPEGENLPSLPAWRPIGHGGGREKLSG